MMAGRASLRPSPTASRYAQDYAGQAGSRWLVLVVLAGSLMRFVGLGEESIWLDEATSIIIARMNLPSVVAWAAGDIHPPLYYLALHFWLRLGESEFAVRALSAVLGILTIGVAYALARELFDQRAGLLAALLLALSPLHVGYSQEARMYVMLTLWSLLASYLLLIALRRQRMRYWLGYVLASALALYTHYFALFVLLFQSLYGFYWLARNVSGYAQDYASQKERWLRWLLAELATALLFLPWVPILYHQATTGGGGWVEKSVGRPSWRALADTWASFSVGLDGQLYPALLRRGAYVLFGVCVLSALSALCARRSGEAREGTLFCLMYVGVPLATVWLLSQFKPMYTVRYLLPFLPAYYILVAAGVERLGILAALRGATGSRVGACGTWVRGGVTLVLALIMLCGDWNAERVEHNPDWRAASSFVVAQTQPGDVVLFSPRWNYKPFDYYARGRLALDIDLPIPVTEGAALSVVDEVARRYQRVWLFWERGHYSDPEGIAKRVLEGRFELVETRAFHGIQSLFLYDLRASRTGSN